MKYTSMFFIAVAFASVAAADSLTDSIITTVQAAGGPASDIGIRPPADKLSSLDFVVDSRTTIEGMGFSCATVVESGKLVQVGWSVLDRPNISLLSSAVFTLTESLTARGFKEIATSAAVDGVVVLGKPMSHPKHGYSYWVSLLDRKRQLQVDIEYVLNSPEKNCRWKVSILTNVFIAPDPTAPY